MKGSRDLLFKFCDPVYISGAVEARNFKFGTQIGHWGVLTKKCKIRSKGAVKGSRDLFFKFWDPLYISGTVEARNFKFGTQIGHWGVLTKNA